ncbi:hypothetical protein [Streptomyces bohaiensis]|uniref:hypothetical protein n=1 Tax=Streptomyces bohaiensis TaxID=1431344 RepID=UPI003B7EC933
MPRRRTHHQRSVHYSVEATEDGDTYEAARRLAAVLEELTAAGYDPYPVGDAQQIGCGEPEYGELGVLIGDPAAPGRAVMVTWNSASHTWDPWRSSWEELPPGEPEQRGSRG